MTTFNKELRESEGAVKYLHHRIGNELFDVTCAAELIILAIEDGLIEDITIGKKHPINISTIAKNIKRHSENIATIFEDEYNYEKENNQ